MGVFTQHMTVFLPWTRGVGGCVSKPPLNPSTDLTRQTHRRPTPGSHHHSQGRKPAGHSCPVSIPRPPEWPDAPWSASSTAGLAQSTRPRPQEAKDLPGWGPARVCLPPSQLGRARQQENGQQRRPLQDDGLEATEDEGGRAPGRGTQVRTCSRSRGVPVAV